MKLYVRIRNIGSEKAEPVSVRITGEADVPFDYDVKSDYVGNLDIGEEGEAILKFDVDKDALPKVYPQGIEIRCSGDRDLGDDNVYEVSSSHSSTPGFEAIFAIMTILLIYFLRKPLHHLPFTNPL